MSTTASTMAKTIEQKQQSWLSEKLSSQTFWVLIAVVLACVFLSLYTDSFDTTKNLYNITRNVTFVAIIALGMTLVIRLPGPQMMTSAWRIARMASGFAWMFGGSR